MAIPPTQPVDATRPGRGAITVLLVEDGADDAQLVRQHLQRSGAVGAVTWARTRAEFIAQLSPAVDVVISDHFMPEMDSVQALELIRARGLAIPLIVVTGSLDEDVASRTLRCGAVDFVVKDRLARLVPAIVRAVAERATAHAAAVSAARFAAIFEHAPDAILIIADLRVRQANAAAARLLGLAPVALAGLPVARHLPGMEYHLRAAAAPGGRAAGLLGTALEDAQGRSHDVEVIFSRLPLGDADEWQLIIRDLDGRKAITEELRLLQRAVVATSNGILITDPLQRDNPIIYANPAAERITGYSAAEMIGRNCRFLQGGDRDQPEVAQLRAAVAAGEACTVVLRNRRKDGSEFWNELAVSPIYDESGRVINHLGIQTDVSASREAQIRLILSEHRYRQLIELAPMAVLIQCGGAFAYANPAAQALLGGGEREGLVGREVLDFISPASRDQAREGLLAAEGGSRAAAFPEQEWLRVDGASIQVEVMTTATQHQGRPAALMIVRDIGGRLATERALRVAHAEAALLLSSISAVLIGLRADGTIAQWNEAAERTFGVPAVQAIGGALAATGLAVSVDLVGAAVAECRAQRRQRELVDVPYEHASGRTGFLTMTIVANTADRTRADAGSEILLIGLETTTRKVLETQRNHGQKLESIGQLAAGIAHEINTPIQFIGDNLRFLRDAFADLELALQLQQRALGEGGGGGAPGQDQAALAAAAAAAWRKADLPYLCAEIPRATQQSIEGVERVGGIVRAMKEFSHPGQEGAQPSDLNHAIQTTLVVARNEYKYVAEAVTDLDAELPAVTCFLGELNQVFLNLIVNAAHAIAAANADGRKGTVSISSRKVGEQVELRFGDDGTGIPESARKKIFDPFFTTKPVGKGTGQGLYLCHAIVVQRHGGTITFETETGKGTTFIVRLPISRPEPG